MLSKRFTKCYLANCCLVLLTLKISPYGGPFIPKEHPGLKPVSSDNDIDDSADASNTDADAEASAVATSPVKSPVKKPVNFHAVMLPTFPPAPNANEESTENDALVESH